MERKEAVTLLKELGDQLLVLPSMVVIESPKAGHFQLKIKGEYDYKEIELFLKNRGYFYEVNKDYLIIYKR